MIPLTLFNHNLSPAVLTAYCQTIGREIILRNLAFQLCNKHESHDALNHERGRFVLTFSRLMTYIYVVPHRQPPDVAFYIFIQQIYVLNILNMLHTLLFFLFKIPFIS